MARRRKLLVAVLGVLVIVATIGGVRGGLRTAEPTDPAMAPTPTIRENGGRRVNGPLHRGRIRVMQIQAGELRLEGQVVDDAEKPVGGVKVTLGHARETVTESDGSFAFDQAAAADYPLTAEKQDAYAEESTSLTPTSDPITLKLRRGAQLVVHVVDAATTAPIANATVKTADRTGVTDDSGTVMLRAIDGGYERFEVSADGRAPVKSWVTSDSPAARLERTVALGRAAPVSGIVVDGDGRPVPKASISIEAAAGVWSESVEADATGTWTVGTLGAGRHAAHATSDVHVAMPDLPFETDGIHPTMGVVVRVQLGAQISGIVVDPNGRPVVDVRVRTLGGGDRTDAAGRFLIKGIREGDHDVSARSETGASSDVPVKLARGGKADIRLVFHQSTLAGIAVDGRGQPVARASVTARHKMTEDRRHVTADDYGAFDFGGIEIGDYTISAARDGVIEYDDQVPMSVTTGDRKIRVVVPEVATVRGRVVFDGKPVEDYGLVVSARLNPTWHTPTAVRTTNGRFSRSDIGAGTIVVTIVGSDFASRSIENVTISAGATTDLGDIVVERGRTISGRVVDDRGAPVAGAMVAITKRGPSLYDADDETLRRRLSEPFGRTDAEGRYRISGVPLTTSGREDIRVEATHALGIAPGRVLGTSDTIDLVLARVGVVEGTITNGSDDQFDAIAISVADPAIRFTADLDRAGSFRFARLPAGDYHVRIRGKNTLPAQLVGVAAGGRAVLSFLLPAEPITLTLHAADCRAVALYDLASKEQLDIETCDAGAGEIKHVSPGRYRVCVDLDDDCATVDVAVSPQRQTIVIR